MSPIHAGAAQGALPSTVRDEVLAVPVNSDCAAEMDMPDAVTVVSVDGGAAGPCRRVNSTFWCYSNTESVSFEMASEFPDISAATIFVLLNTK